MSCASSDTALYILGRLSHWDDNEIRYSLRSLECHLPDARVVVVGYLPPFLRDVEHIEADDQTDAKLLNSCRKLTHAVESGSLGERFWLFNDDFFLVAPPDPAPVHRGPLQWTAGNHTMRRGYYYRALLRMRAILLSLGVSDPLDYSLHQPMLIDTERMRETLNTLWKWAPDGFLARSAYGNLHAIGGYWRNDCKRKVEWRPAQKGEWCVSISDGMTRQRRFLDWIEAEYPHPSRWEK